MDFFRGKNSPQQGGGKGGGCRFKMQSNPILTGIQDSNILPLVVFKMFETW